MTRYALVLHHIENRSLEAGIDLEVCSVVVEDEEELFGIPRIKCDELHKTFVSILYKQFTVDTRHL